MTAVVRTSRHQLAARVRQPDGTWLPWRALGGTGVHGDPAAAVDGGGRLFVFGATARTVLAWTRPAAGGPLSGPSATGLPAVTGPLTVRRDGHDAVRLHMRAPGSGHVLTARIGAAGLGTPGGPVRPARVADLGGAAGYGPVAVTRLPDGRTLLAARAENGDLQTAVVDERQDTAGGAPRAETVAARVRWSRTGFLCAGAPAGVSGPRDGDADLAVAGLDGHLYWARTGGSGTVGWSRA